MLPFECQHIQSLIFCPCPDKPAVDLPKEALVEMVGNKWFGEDRKANLLQHQQEADAAAVTLSVKLSVGGPSTKFHISVYEPKMSYYSRLGRVVAAYNSKQNSWHFPCSKARHSCLHKSVGKWHLFATQRELFKNVKSTKQETISPQPTTDQMDTSEMKEGFYPPIY